jgi:hypothetical protein
MLRPTPPLSDGADWQPRLHHAFLSFATTGECINSIEHEGEKEPGELGARFRVERGEEGFKGGKPFLGHR